MTGQLIINGKDAFTTWGVVLEQDALSALMAPAPLKPFPENKSRIEHGKQVLTTIAAKIDERTISLPLIMTAATEAAFRAAYFAFVTELQAGALTITTSFLPGVKFRMIYENCQQFTQFQRQTAKFLLRLTEPNPNNRAI